MPVWPIRVRDNCSHQCRSSWGEASAISETICCRGIWLRELETCSDHQGHNATESRSLLIKNVSQPWTLKVALLIQLYACTRTSQERGHFIPGSHLRWLWEHQRLSSPAPGTRVWIGMVIDPQWLVRLQPSSLATFPGNPPDAYFVSLSLGYLLFYVFGVEFVNKDLTSIVTLELPRNLAQTLMEVWPGRGMDLVCPTPQLIPAALSC